MTRTLTGTIYKPDGTAWASDVVTVQLLAAFTTATEVYPTKTVSITLENDGTIPDGTVLGVPDTGTAHYRITYPNGHGFECYIAAGASVDLVTLETIAGSSVDQDDLQTLLDAAERFTNTNAAMPYTQLATDEYIRTTGTGALTLLALTSTQPPLMVKNIGTGTVTITSNGSDTIDGLATYTLYPGESVVLVYGAAGRWDAN